MRITYVANIRMPTERAHGAQVVHMCEAFTRAGAEITLVVPNRRNPIEEDTFSYYGFASKPFETPIYVPVLDIVSWGKIGFFVENFLFAWNARHAIEKGSVIYGRDELVLFFLYLFGERHLVWESHTGAWNFAARFLCRKLQTIIVISKGLKDWYVAKGVSAEKLYVAHDGVTVSDFRTNIDKESHRKRLGLPLDKKIALYIGALDRGKGADVFCRAATLLPTPVQAVVIGGSERDLKTYRELYPQVFFLGPRPYKELPENQATADVLVIPNSGQLPVWSQFTSPLKLFAALASTIPVVASATPSILEVVTNESVYLFTPDDPRALADAIQKALEDRGEKTQKAHTLSERYDWGVRANNILAFILKQKD